MSADLTPRRLSSELAVHPLGVGCWAIGGPTVNNGHPVGWSTADDGRSLEGLRRAIAHGATLFDTADVYGYGHSERLLRRILDEHRREKLCVSSKVGWIRGSAPHPYSGPKLYHQLQQTLDNLGTEYLDVYFLHTLDFGDDDRYLGDAIDQMRALKDTGAIRAIGMRGPHPLASDRHDVADIRSARFLKIFRLLHPDVLWTRFNPLSPPPLIEGEDLFSFTARHGVALFLNEPLAQGLLTGKYNTAQPPVFGPGDHRRHKRWFTAQGFATIESGLELLRARFGDDPDALVRIALRYSLQRADHTVVLAGFTSPEQVDQNYDGLGEPLTRDELALVDAVYGQIRTDLQAMGDSVPLEISA